MGESRLFSALRPALHSLRQACGLSRDRYFRSLNRVEFDSSGFDEDSRPWVRLRNGLTFTGYPPKSAEMLWYVLFASRRLRRTVSKGSLGVAIDIARRYLAPPHGLSPLSQGKYYGLKPGMTVLEIGAYLGYYALRAASQVGPTGRVVAVEAVPENYEILVRNVARNKIGNILTRNVAAWSETATLSFYRQSNQAGSLIQGIVSPSEAHLVRAESVDEIAKASDLGRVDFVRIQVNGAEMEVLKGMPGILATRPTLLVAAPYAVNGQPSSALVSDFLRQHGYPYVSNHSGNIFAANEREIVAEAQKLYRMP